MFVKNVGSNEAERKETKAGKSVKLCGRNNHKSRRKKDRIALRAEEAGGCTVCGNRFE